VLAPRGDVTYYVTRGASLLGPPDRYISAAFIRQCPRVPGAEVDGLSFRAALFGVGSLGRAGTGAKSKQLSLLHGGTRSFGGENIASVSITQHPRRSDENAISPSK